MLECTVHVQADFETMVAAANSKLCTCTWSLGRVDVTVYARDNLALGYRI